MTATNPEEHFDKTFRLVRRLDADIDDVRHTAESIRRCVTRVLAVNPSATADHRHADRRRDGHARSPAPDASGNGRRTDRVAGPAGTCRVTASSRRAAALVMALLAAPCPTAFAASQMFKCVDGGRTVYQQQACALSAQPDAAPGGANAAPGATASATMAKASAPAADAAPTAQRKIRSPTSPASAAPATLR